MELLPLIVRSAGQPPHLPIAMGPGLPLRRLTGPSAPWCPHALWQIPRAVHSLLLVSGSLLLKNRRREPQLPACSQPLDPKSWWPLLGGFSPFGSWQGPLCRAFLRFVISLLGFYGLVGHTVCWCRAAPHAVCPSWLGEPTSVRDPSKPLHHRS